MFFFSHKFAEKKRDLFAIERHVFLVSQVSYQALIEQELFSAGEE